MQQTLIDHPTLQVRLVTGNEGPAYDPYRFDEYTVTVPSGTVVVHLGLAVWAKVGDQQIDARGNDYDRAHEWADRVLADSVGYSLMQLARISRKAKRQCPEGGRHDTMEMRGYPGETFSMCAKCGKVVDSYFCEGAVI